MFLFKFCDKFFIDCLFHKALFTSQLSIVTAHLTAGEESIEITVILTKDSSCRLALEMPKSARVCLTNPAA